MRAGDTPVLEALLAEDVSLVSVADDNGNSAVMLAMYYGHPEVVPILLQSGCNLSPFEGCALGGSEAVERQLALRP